MRGPCSPLRPDWALLFPCRVCPSWQDRFSSPKGASAEVKIQGGSPLWESRVEWRIRGHSHLVHGLLSRSRISHWTGGFSCTVRTPWIPRAC